MKNLELVFLPCPGVGHFSSMAEAAKLLVDQHACLSITILIMKKASDTKIANRMDSLAASDRLHFISLPVEESDSTILTLIEKYNPHIKEAVSKKLTSPDNKSSLAGFVLDMFCTPVMDVANEFGVPSYIFFTSSAAFLACWLHLQLLQDEHGVDLAQFKDSDTELALPSFAKLLPARLLPTPVFQKEWSAFFIGISRRLREAKGIIVNTFMELESHALISFSDGKIKSPPVYPVGPILNLKGSDEGSSDRSKEIMDWLDDQPPSSVVFLCFGSMGGFPEDQTQEIAHALEHSGHRFVWSLRQPLQAGKVTTPDDYQNVASVLPSGFLDRTAEIGKIMGWAPQAAILAHPATGGFVSHCGWNSILESICCGVPIATWPMYAEQQLNAFQMVRDLGLAVEIKLDYRKDCEAIVKAEDIERGIRCVMEHDSEVRMKAKEMSEKSRKALKDGGSSFSSLNRFIQDVIDISHQKVALDLS